MRDILWSALHVQGWTEFTWVMVGLAGQFLFTARFLVQWIASEKQRRSVVPVAFWYFSLAGGTVLLTYALWRRDPVFVLGQSMGLLIYLRNLWLIHAERPGRATES
ncbi:MAG: lipid-A-disaccharide synthase N-terminal domain-containing protein [Rhodobacteraceae bacterium]|jgi:lipid-A-disaccharide synthase-like uncharacterized protein|nr:lipid-A-disaccharide synthase N-terminal domain-containing protein [Paracoccaceae bacterium]